MYMRADECTCNHVWVNFCDFRDVDKYIITINMKFMSEAKDERMMSFPVAPKLMREADGNAFFKMDEPNEKKKLFKLIA